MGRLEREINAAIRADYGRVLAALIGWLRDFALAEDALGDALLRAAERWPVDGLPRRPAAWLLTVARRAALDRLRKGKVRAAPLAQATLKLLAEEADAARPLPGADEDIPDERLRLIFTCCHPALAPEAQIALTLKTLCGLSARDIAQAFLVQESTMLARLTRAKAKIAGAGIPFELPARDQLAARRDSVLHVIYLIYTAAHAAYDSDQHAQTDLAREALHLADVLFALLPEPECQGLLALLMLHDSRRAARLGADGAWISLQQQDRRQWDAGLIEAGRAHLVQALSRRRPGPYQIQAAISALHAEAADFASTDWAQIAGLYRALEDMTPSPIVSLNRAAALGFGGSAEAGLALVEPLAEALVAYQPFYATRADLLARLGRAAAAEADYLKAISMSANPAEKDWLTTQMHRLKQAPDRPNLRQDN